MNKDALEAYPINLPSLEVQMGIVAKLDKIEAESKKLESHYRAKLADLDDLRQALLQKAFAGQLC